MDDRKVYLLAELTILPNFLYEVKAIFGEAIGPALQEPGCEALFETSRDDDPYKLVFFEAFSSPEAHRIHFEQDYTKRMFSALEGKLASAPVMTKLNPLWLDFYGTIDDMLQLTTLPSNFFWMALGTGNRAESFARPTGLSAKLVIMTKEE